MRRALLGFTLVVAACLHRGSTNEATPSRPVAWDATLREWLLAAFPDRDVEVPQAHASAVDSLRVEMVGDFDGYLRQEAVRTALRYVQLGVRDLASVEIVPIDIECMDPREQYPPCSPLPVRRLTIHAVEVAGPDAVLAAVAAGVPRSVSLAAIRPAGVVLLIDAGGSAEARRPVLEALRGFEAPGP